MPRVAVLGGAGYVGARVCTQLLHDGADVTAVIRPSSGFLLDRLGVRWAAVDDAHLAGPFDVVVNLAFPTSGSVYEYPELNEVLLDRIKRLASPDGSVIQISTQAVFGMALERPQVVGPLPMRRDFLYVETKLELENLLASNLDGTTLHTVRLGNVWGPGSAAWTGAVAQRLVFGAPTLTDGPHAYSNVTDIANLVSYVSFLTHSSTPSGTRRYHHLAELGDTPWQYWVERMASHLSVVPVVAPPAAYPYSPRQEVLGAVLSHPRALAGELKDGRFAGSAVRSLMRSLPRSTSRIMRRRWASGSGSLAVTGEEDLLLTVLGCETRLVPAVDSSWVPPLDRDASWTAIASWLNHVGYT